MPSHSSVAKRVRLMKEKYPDHYCSDSRCLWRRYNGQTREITECPKHPRKES